MAARHCRLRASTLPVNGVSPGTCGALLPAASTNIGKPVEAIADFRNELLRSFEQADGGPIDVVICPAYAVPAVRHGATELMPMPGAYGPIANVSGFPAGVVPVTRVRSGEESDRPASRDVVDRVARGTRTRQRRPADRRAGDCAAMARPCRARRHGHDRSGRKEDAGLSGAAPAMNETLPGVTNMRAHLRRATRGVPARGRAIAAGAARGPEKARRRDRPQRQSPGGGDFGRFRQSFAP